MGKNPKRSKNKSENTSGVKRKNTVNEDELPTKRKKDEKWFPGKFVLLKKLSEEVPEASENQPKASIKGKRKEPNINGKSSQKPMNENSKQKKDSETDLEKFYENDLSESDDEEWMHVDDEELSLESTSEDSELGEEWSTDTDYSEGDSLDDEEHSFHESDCESVSDHEDDIWDANSSDDSDYIPDIEDKYIILGEAITYEAKGLDLAFGNSLDSQIIDISDVHPAIMQQDEEVPELIATDASEDISMEHGEGRRYEIEPDSQTTEVNEAEVLIDELRIEEDDDNLECAELLKHATFYDCTSDQGVILKLTNTIHFHGILIIRAIANNIQVNGYTLKPDEIITATSMSRADYFLNLTPIAGENYSKEKLQSMVKDLLSDDNAAKLFKTFNPELEAIVHLQQGLPDTTVEMLKNYSTNALLPSKKMILTNSPCQSSELILSAKFFVACENKKISSFELNEQWNNLEVKSNTKLVVIGGKNVGKSGLCQFLINKNMESFKKILLVDLDIGQPICGASQTISASVITKPIIGPGYLSKIQPDKSFIYGDKSVMISPFKYVRCVRKLMEFCAGNQDYQNIPWVINTMGYQKGFGLQLICLLIRILQPTDVVQVQHGIRSYNFSKILTEEIVNGLGFSFFDVDDIADVPQEAFFTTHVLDSIVNNREDDLATKWISNSSDKRKLSMLAQLSKLLKGNQTSLNDVTPFVALASKIKLVVFDEEFSQQESAVNMDVLNGNLVYLCHADGTESLDSNSILECYGVGIVRGIDKTNDQIFILLPETDDVVSLQAKINVLAIGNIPLPSEVLLKQNYSIKGKVPYVTFFKDRGASSKKYINKRSIKDCY